VNVAPSADPETLKFWPQVQSEVRNWKFTPFVRDGKPTAAEVEEYVGLLPAERLPTRHVSPPAIRPNSEVSITLERSRCFGACPAYTVHVSTEGITFEGLAFVVASGSHTESVDSGDVRALAGRFVAADFYSMDAAYRASVTDCATYTLSISIDGRKKEVEDYVGEWEGMPSVISELEKAVDAFARTDRWIEGNEGLVPALRAEEFPFGTFPAQRLLKEAASRGQSTTVRSLLDAGVPLDPLPAAKAQNPQRYAPFEQAGWLAASAQNPETLAVLIGAGASRSDQADKDLALAEAARSGKLEAVRALIGYGANPDADLSRPLTGNGETPGTEARGTGSVLIYAAESGDPEVVQAILRYHPRPEVRDGEGKTALFAAASGYRHGERPGARVECVRLLVHAGADVNARDLQGNTPLHQTFLPDVEEELIKSGADVNARNNEGETPIFASIDEDSIRLLVAHGADLTIRNNHDQTALQAAEEKGASRVEALRKVLLGVSH
jgi:ankyrin repeat protein